MERDRNKDLHKIKSILEQWHHGPRHSQQEKVILPRNRIGHTQDAHSFLVKYMDSPECLAGLKTDRKTF